MIPDSCGADTTLVKIFVSELLELDSLSAIGLLIKWQRERERENTDELLPMFAKVCSQLYVFKTINLNFIVSQNLLRISSNLFE